jgi:hypothetical protein
MKDDYIAYASAMAAAAGAEQVALSQAQAAREQAGTAARSTYERISAAHKYSDNVTDATNSGLWEQSSGSTRHAREAEQPLADRDLLVRYAELDESHLVAYAQAEKVYGTSVAAVDAGGEYSAALHTFNQAKADADYEWALGYSSADETWSQQTANADRDFAEASLQDSYQEQTTRISQEMARALADRNASSSQSSAEGIAAGTYAIETTIAANVRRSAEYSAETSFQGASYANSASAIDQISSSVQTPWMQFQAERAVVQLDWWSQEGSEQWGTLVSALNQADLSFAVSSANHQSAWASHLADSLETYEAIEGENAHDRQVSHLSAQQCYEEAIAAASEGFQVEESAIRALERNALAHLSQLYPEESDPSLYSSAHSAALQSVRAEMLARRQAANERFAGTVAIAEANRKSREALAQVTYVSLHAEHWNTRERELVNQQETYSIGMANDRLAHDIAAADARYTMRLARASSMALATHNLATAEPSPWSRLADAQDAALELHVSGVADAELHQSMDIAIAEAAREVAYAHAQAERDQALFAATEAHWETAETSAAAVDLLESSLLLTLASLSSFY